MATATAAENSAGDVWVRCPENMAHIRQSTPDSGLSLQVKVLEKQ